MAAELNQIKCLKLYGIAQEDQVEARQNGLLIVKNELGRAGVINQIQKAEDSIELLTVQCSDEGDNDDDDDDNGGGDDDDDYVIVVLVIIVVMVVTIIIAKRLIRLPLKEQNKYIKVG